MDYRKVILPVVLLTATTAHGEQRMMNQGVICDTVEQVIQVVDNATTGVPLHIAVNSVQGCGELRGNALVTVTPIAPYENEHVIVLIGQIDFNNQLGTQYGWIGFTFKAVEQAEAPESEV